MSRALVYIEGPVSRQRAIRAVQVCPLGSRIEFKGVRRTLAQNDRMWAMLTDVAQQKKHGDRRYTTDQWKVLFMHACGREVQFIPSLDGATFIPWGQSSSDLSKQEMTDLIEFIAFWGAENGVVFQDNETPGVVPSESGEAAGAVPTLDASPLPVQPVPGVYGEARRG